jgi:hypothetical protein
MEIGMADYAQRAATASSVYIDSINEYDRYCHYVAGLVGEGLSRLFSASGKDSEWLASQLEISSSVVLLLQKTSTNASFSGHVRYGVARSMGVGAVPGRSRKCRRCMNPATSSAPPGSRAA